MSKKKGALSLTSSKDDEDDDEDDETVDESELTVSDRGSLSENVLSSNSSAVAKKKEPASLEDETKRSRVENIQLEETVVEEDVSSERREMWNDLLNKRPRSKDPKGLSKWLNEVLSVSDLQFPLEKVGAENARGGSPLGRVLANELSKLTKDGAVDSAMDTTNSSSTTADTLTKDTANSSNDGDSAKNEKTPVKDNTVASQNKSDVKSLKKNLGKRKKDNEDDDDETDSDEGFAGSFADWRERKKGK